jgi:hypothetical protein
MINTEGIKIRVLFDKKSLSGHRLKGIKEVNPNVAEIFGPKALRSLYIRPSRND